MKTLKLSLRAYAALALLLTAAPASAEIGADARASIASFYDALSTAPGKDVAALVKRATAPEWTSCGSNETCATRDQVIANISALQRAVPDLRWDIKELLALGDRVIVRGEATGTPIGDFRGALHSGRSFKLMSIDVHTVAGGKLVRSYHVEDWFGAIRQLSAP